MKHEHISKRTQRRVARHIRHRDIGKRRLTQAQMEDFLRNDAFFVHATPGFFTEMPPAVASG